MAGLTVSVKSCLDCPRCDAYDDLKEIVSLLADDKLGRTREQAGNALEALEAAKVVIRMQEKKNHRRSRTTAFL